MEESLPSSPYAVLESRKELITSPTAEEDSIFRTAHFLKPSSTPIDESLTNPSSNLLPSIHSSSLKPRKWGLRISFNGWRNPQLEWKNWVVKMVSLHASTWKKAGVYEAILNSTYQIHRNKDLILGVAERWCSETSSFIFPWGEATITLEDIVVISGYSTLGSPVFSALESENLRGIEARLIKARKELAKTPCHKARHIEWRKKFMNSGSNIEHEAFLSMWLSRFVLPTTSSDVINACVFPIAILLSIGTRIALAPAVLASIYRDLRLLRERIDSLTIPETETRKSGQDLLAVQSPFQLVQVWIWERFIELQPNPNPIKCGETRLSRWGNVKCKVENVSMVLASAATKDRFLWRPLLGEINTHGTKICCAPPHPAHYSGPPNHRLRYHLLGEIHTHGMILSALGPSPHGFPKMPHSIRENGMSILVDSTLQDEWMSFVKCLRVSGLVGVVCVEKYLPHRVAMQFGYDQDLPGCVVESILSPEKAWSDYTRPLGQVGLYIPARAFEGGVTTRYKDWWEKSLLAESEHSNGKKNLFSTGASSSVLGFCPKTLSETSFMTGKRKKTDAWTAEKYEPIFKIKSEENANLSELSPCSSKIARKLSPGNIAEINNPPVPPGFPPKCNEDRNKARSSVKKCGIAAEAYMKGKGTCIDESAALGNHSKRETESTSCPSQKRQENVLSGSPGLPQKGSKEAAEVSKTKKKGTAKLRLSSPLKYSEKSALNSERKNQHILGQSSEQPERCLKRKFVSHLLQLQTMGLLTIHPPAGKSSSISDNGAVNHVEPPNLESSVAAAAPARIVQQVEATENESCGHLSGQYPKVPSSTAPNGILENLESVPVTVQKVGQVQVEPTKDGNAGNPSGQSLEIPSSVAENDSPRHPTPRLTASKRVSDSVATTGVLKRPLRFESMSNSTILTTVRTRIGSIESRHTFELPGLELEAKIVKLEKQIAVLKAAARTQIPI